MTKMRLHLYMIAHLSLLPLLLATPSLAFNFDGDGLDGRAGTNGESYSSQVRPNPRSNIRSRSQCQTTPGRHGTDGGNGTRGGRAADFDLQVSDVGQILVTGTVTRYDSGLPRTQDLRETTQITSILQVTAQGGRGGRAGQGGNGEGAQSGQDSSDHASNEHETGGDGCDAGLAGQGGDSGRPGDGGDGGHIRIRLSSEDTHLILALSTQVSGGQPGETLRGGDAGERASGGQGGDGFYEDRSGDYPTGRMVNEPGCTPRAAGNYGTGRYEDEPGCTPTSGSYEDRNCGYSSSLTSDTETLSYSCDQVWVPGRTCRQVEITEYRSAITCRQVPEMAYRRVIVRTDAGSRGAPSPTARDGRDSEPASPGQNGSVIYEVVDRQTGRVTTYSSGVHISLETVAYDLVDQDENGIFEPGEQVQIRNLRIRNRGNLDYQFSKVDTLVFLQSSSWLIANPQTLEIPRIRAGETLTIADPGLSFTIRNNQFRANEVTPQWEESIVPANRITRIERNFRSLNLPQQFYISFPVRVSAFQVPGRIEAGQSVPISWSIQNLAGRDIPELGPYARTVLTELDFMPESLSQEDIAIQTQAPSTQPGAMVQMISGLRAFETRVVEGTLSISADAEPYTTGRLALGLSINQFGLRERVALQQLERQIQVTRVYRTRAEDDVLLVLNESNRDIYRSWMRLFSEMGLQANIWDLSIDGGFSFFSAIAGGGSLSRDFSDKTVILPKVLDRSGRNASLQRAHQELYAAAQDQENNLYLIGYSNLPQQALLESELSHQEVIQHRSLEQFLNRLRSFSEIRPEQVHEVSVEESYLFVRTPRMDKMLVERDQLVSALQTKFPEDNFSVAIVFDPTPLPGTVYANFRLGHLMVRKMPQQDRGRLVVLPTQQSQIGNSLINSMENARSLCLALNSQTRLKVLDRALQTASATASRLRMVLACVQHDIYQNWYHKPTDADLTSNHLEAIAAVLSRHPQVGMDKVIEFQAMLEIMAEDGGFAPVQTQAIASSAVRRSLTANDLNQLETFKELMRSRIRRSQQRSGEDLTIHTQKVILKSINPRAQTSGKDAEDV